MCSSEYQRLPLVRGVQLAEATTSLPTAAHTHPVNNSECLLQLPVSLDVKLTSFFAPVFPYSPDCACFLQCVLAQRTS